MRILVILIFLVVGCGSKQAPEAENYESIPTVTDSERGPTSEEPSAERAQKGEIDLGLEGGYGQVEVDDDSGPKLVDHSRVENSDELDWSCDEASDCQGRGLPRYKKPGRWHCVENRCKMEYIEPGDIKELF